MNRDTLPNRRSNLTFTMSFQGDKYHVTTGFYGDGRFGETFINRIRDKTASKLAEQLDAVCRDSAILISLCLQHKVTLETIRHSVTRDDDSSPMSVIGAIIDSIEIEAAK
jgi:hypothetical protein